jgi:hypothetical protein
MKKNNEVKRQLEKKMRTFGIICLLFCIIFFASLIISLSEILSNKIPASYIDGTFFYFILIIFFAMAISGFLFTYVRKEWLRIANKKDILNFRDKNPFFVKLIIDPTKPSIAESVLGRTNIVKIPAVELNKKATPIKMEERYAKKTNEWVVILVFILIAGAILYFISFRNVQIGDMIVNNILLEFASVEDETLYLNAKAMQVISYVLFAVGVIGLLIIGAKRSQDERVIIIQKKGKTEILKYKRSKIKKTKKKR